MLLNQPVRQIAYYVDDVAEACRRHSALYGSGPFFIQDLPEYDVIYRGQDSHFDHVSAIGQWGSMQVEFMHQPGDEPSVIRELYPAGSGRTGIHHVALFVDDLADAVTQITEAGFPEAARIMPKGSDLVLVFMDAIKQYGHFIELYEPKPVLLNVFDMVAKAAVGFTGDDPVRSMNYNF